ncbi:hypothetical protein M406DRAFT_334415 [Cryphonectria parasitica EP155]|uniref:CCHC-type domain-containing protein n=1 Tax=Cryphonectria parasitica (strain ATCC 38755 / EP155) TaxID=660469 RepID=A0A9P4XU29_CRYP1|nr:uncharacterized protein M406DRAFT_334415 [Cryphonectria parasitica EP155]KAF3760797.1 hypothetical protein M406DRAFT_334415 [Cryphonectria parasitica EP155]
MADAEVTVDGGAEMTAANDVLTPGDGTLPEGAGEAVKPVARGETSPAATGKRPIVDAVQDQGQEEQAEEDLPPRKKARKGSSLSSADGHTPTSVDEGEISSPRTEKRSTSSPSDGAQGSEQQGGNPDLLIYNPLTPHQRDGLVQAIQAGEAETVAPVNKRDLLWTVNPIKSEYVVGTTWLEIFESILDKWCEAFVAQNQENIEKVGLAPSFLKKAFMRRLEGDITPDMPQLMHTTAKKHLKDPETSRLRDFAGDFKPDPKKMAKNLAKKQAKEAKAKETKRQQQPNVTSDNPVQPNDANNGSEVVSSDHAAAQQTQDTTVEKEDGEVDEDQASDVEMDAAATAPEEISVPQAELDQRHHYYPEVPDNAVFCLTCAQAGHSTTSCPEAKCKFCSGPHFNYECPTRQRCSKCRKLGHTKAKCSEKLAAAPGEVTMECAVCEGHDHSEQNCTSLWQVYRPQPGKVKKVKSLPIFCYCCGEEGHYGGDCGLADLSVPPTKIWTYSVASLYIDPASNEEALAYRNPLPPPPTISAPVIPGRSIKPQSHIFFEESDDEDHADALVRGTAARPAQKPMGKIQIASNISFGGPPAISAAGPSNPKKRQQPQQNTNNRYPRRDRNPWPDDSRPIPPPLRQGGKDYPLRNGRKVPKAGQGELRSQAAGGSQQGGSRGGGGGNNRGRGGFSSFSKRNRGRGFK